ncbi:hypothetical protein CCR95_24095 [Thiocystis minor]|uniref:Calx-beta domain-containing protein n=1 Tax=Thiocystis minor TaxID=61597 RepID=UPI0019123466|nr:Calx-beta domain-containing protein [Thiocystis minor]MBK5967064.1 hypothetical protein [Thiocystis minor]
MGWIKPYLALKRDGTVWSWDDFFSRVPTKVSGIDNVIAIRSSNNLEFDYNVNYAIKRDGTVWWWGGRRVHQHEVEIPRIPTKIKELTNVIDFGANADDLSINGMHELALTGDRSAFIWGYNDPWAYWYQWGDGLKAECPNGGNSCVNIWRDAPGGDPVLDNVAAIATEYSHSVALGHNGRVYAWGAWATHRARDTDGNYYDQYDYFPTPTAAGGLTNVIAIDAGVAATVAMKDDLSVWLWGALEIKDNWERFDPPRQIFDARGTAPFTCGDGGGHRLTVTKAGRGSGRVTSDPMGIDCGSACTLVYIPGVAVALTAIPESGSRFQGWSQDCSGTGGCSVKMDKPRNVTATFDLLTLAINDVTKAEGHSDKTTFTFTVRLSGASIRTVSVNYLTVNGTATLGSDYIGTAGTLTFKPGETSKTFNISVVGDNLKEANETFFVNLSLPNGATLTDTQGVGTILNDDGAVLRINDVRKAEGQSGSGAATFLATLSAPSVSTVTVKYATANGTAMAGSDYAATSGTLTFSPGQTSKPFSVNVMGDTAKEANETFAVNLSAPSNATLFDSQGVGTILNDD